MHIDETKDKILICTEMQDSELFTSQASSKLYERFNNDLDTFAILALDTEVEDMD